MIQPKYNPKEALERAKLLMNYDSKKTLSENKRAIDEYNFGPVNYVAPVIASATGGATAAGSVATSWPAFIAAISTPAAAVTGVVAVVGVALWWAYRNASNEDGLKKTVQACNAVLSANAEKQLMKDALLSKDEHIRIADDIYGGVTGRGSFLFGLADSPLFENEKLIFDAFKRLEKGNAADVCGVVFEYQLQGNFADDLADDLSESELSTCIASLRIATSEYAGEGKIFPPGSLSTSWYRGKFPCIFKTINTVVPNSVEKDENGYTYIVVKGLKRSDGKQRLYRLRGEDGAILSSDGTQTSNARLECDPTGAKPVVITEAKLRKAVITEQGIDDSQILFSDELLATDVEKWNTGKYVVTWDVWLRKFTCLRQKFPNATPKVDEDGFTYFENKQPADGKIYRMYSDGEIWTDTGDNTNKKWSCAPRGGKIIIESKSKKKLSEQIDIEPPTGGGGGSSSGGGGTPPQRDRIRFCPNGFRTCSGTYTKCCSSPKIAEAQTCLNLTPDGKWGPNTQAKLSASFPQFANSFTDADISTICSGSSPALKPDDVGGAVNQINALDTNF